MKETRQSKSGPTNIEEIRQKNLKDNQLFLQKLRINDVNLFSNASRFHDDISCIQDSQRSCQINSKDCSTKKERKHST